MVKKLQSSRGGRLLGMALVCGAVLLAGFLVGRASAAQPHMRMALDHLKAAKAQLEVAESNKGGHRLKALGLVNDAIDEVREGMGFARAH
jgi:hypothetical protein